MFTFHIRTFSCCCQVVQQMWTSTVFVPSSHSATVTAVQLIYSTDSNGKWNRHFKQFWFGYDFLQVFLNVVLSADHYPVNCYFSLSWIVIEPSLRPSLTLILWLLTYIFVLLTLLGGSGPLYRRWLLFKDSSCCTSVQGVQFFQLCPTEGILTKVPFSSSWLYYECNSLLLFPF